MTAEAGGGARARPAAGDGSGRGPAPAAPLGWTGMGRLDWALAVGLGALALVTRLPFRARLLPTWDAVQFALALGEYDVVKHQPHPPGYILYVGAARALAPLFGDAAACLAALSIGASALTVVLLYRLAWALDGRAPAVVAAAGLLASPLFWFYGEVPLSYAAEALLATALALLCWATGTGRRRALLWSAVLLGAAGGVRQSILLVMLPLWLGMAWAGVRRAGPILAATGALAATTAAWLVPMLWLTGGVRPYVGAGLELYESTVRATTVLDPSGRWLSNVVGLGEAFVLGLGLLLPVLAWALAREIRSWRADRLRAGLLAGWMLPALAVYAFVHLGQHGYLLTVLPACYLLVAGPVVRGGRRLAALRAPGGARRWRPILAGDGARRWRPALGAVALALLLGPHALFFVGAPSVDVPFPPASAPWPERLRARALAFYRFTLRANTAPGLRDREAVIDEYVETVRRSFDPSDTILVTETGNGRSYPWFRHAMYYLPDFAVYHLRVDGGAPGYLVASGAGWRRPGVRALAAVPLDDRVFLPASTRRLVWVVDYWNPREARPPGLEARPLAHGRWLYVLKVGRRPVEYAGYQLVRVAAVARRR